MKLGRLNHIGVATPKTNLVTLNLFQGPFRRKHRRSGSKNGC
jgi:hypothetical protein